MPRPRGHEHTTLTETATLVVHVVKKVPGVKMIAPGEINTTSRTKSGKRFVTIVYTPAGCELIITGQSVQKVAIHMTDPQQLLGYLQKEKSLRDFSFKVRDRNPGI